MGGSFPNIIYWIAHNFLMHLMYLIRLISQWTDYTRIFYSVLLSICLFLLQCHDILISVTLQSHESCRTLCVILIWSIHIYLFFHFNCRISLYNSVKIVLSCNWYYFDFFLKLLLEYSLFTMLCEFQVYSKVVVIHIVFHFQILFSYRLSQNIE